MKLFLLVGKSYSEMLEKSFLFDWEIFFKQFNILLVWGLNFDLRTWVSICMRLYLTYAISFFRIFVCHGEKFFTILT